MNVSYEHNLIFTTLYMYYFTLQIGNKSLGRVNSYPKSHTNAWLSWASVDSEADIPGVSAA